MQDGLGINAKQHPATMLSHIPQYSLQAQRNRLSLELAGRALSTGTNAEDHAALVISKTERHCLPGSHLVAAVDHGVGENRMVWPLCQGSCQLRNVWVEKPPEAQPEAVGL
jgi:hypothetical protein